jgi:hypothetical protein
MPLEGPPERAKHAHALSLTHVAALPIRHQMHVPKKSPLSAKKGLIWEIAATYAAT